MKIACIGSRDISPETKENLVKIGKFIAFKGWTVVTGNALGSDAAFAEGANQVDPTKVWLHLPWWSYNKELIHPKNVIRPSDPSWSELARKHHPVYDSLTQGAKKMMDRNAGIILDSSVVIAVLNHKKSGFGGTGHGWRVAGELNLPRLDLSKINNIEEVFEFLENEIHNRKSS